MNDCQFRSIMAVLWLIAANVDTNQNTAIACAVFFVGYSVGALIASFDRRKAKDRG